MLENFFTGVELIFEQVANILLKIFGKKTIYIIRIVTQFTILEHYQLWKYRMK